MWMKGGLDLDTKETMSDGAYGFGDCPLVLNRQAYRRDILGTSCNWAVVSLLHIPLRRPYRITGSDSCLENS
jgi:hypothetical protein